MADGAVWEGTLCEGEDDETVWVRDIAGEGGRAVEADGFVGEGEDGGAGILCPGSFPRTELGQEGTSTVRVPSRVVWGYCTGQGALHDVLKPENTCCFCSSCLQRPKCDAQDDRQAKKSCRRLARICDAGQ